MRETINPTSLKNFYAWGEPMGFSFEVNYNRYRNVPVSCLEKLVLTVDGKKIDPLYIHFCINGKKFRPDELPDLYNEYWAFQEPAVIEVDQMGGLSEGSHEIDLYLLGRAPYISVPFYVTDPKNQPHTYRVSNMGAKVNMLLQK